MPSRMPIIPASAQNRMILRALHDEMQERNFIERVNTESKQSSPSQDHNLIKVINSEPNPATFPQDSQPKEMPRHAIRRENVLQINHNVQANSSSGSSSTNHSDQSDSSSFVEYSKRETEHIQLDADQHQHYQKSSEVFGERRKINFSEKDKQQIREGYQRYVLNGERPPTALSFENKTAQMDKNEAEGEIFFPLESAAAGKVEDIAIKDVMKIEKITKKKTKHEKQAISEAKLSVAEAKQNEFDAKLRARQARIDEHHAKLCYRRAIIKRAEERLQNLESQLDDEEECHRDRERRVKNRERRVRQEEAGIQIKEESLRRREEKVTANLNEIDRRRKLVDEKEKMCETMEDILSIKENQVKQKQEKKQKLAGSAPFMRLLKKPAYKSGNPSYKTTSGNRELYDATVPRTESSSSSGTAPVPVPRKTVKSNQEDRAELNASINQEFMPKTAGNFQRPSIGKNGKKPNLNFSDQKPPLPTMGLWL